MYRDKKTFSYCNCPRDQVQKIIPCESASHSFPLLFATAHVQTIALAVVPRAAICLKTISAIRNTPATATPSILIRPSGP
jgi:hypothetical protein